MAEVDVKITCRLGWKLLQEYDNSNNTNTTITRSVEVVKSKIVKGRDYTKAVNETSREEASKLSLDVSATATWGPVSATVSSGYETSSTLKDFVSSTTEVTREAEESWSHKETQSMTIGPGDRLYFYQQVFSGPGLYFTLDTTSVVSRPKTAEDERDVVIAVRARAVEFVRELGVAFGDNEGDAPDERVREVHRQSDDTNAGHKGKYVWLVPQYTLQAGDAATAFEVRIQGSSMAGMGDLASGAGGDYRYAVTSRDRRQTQKVVEVKLWRSDSQVTPDQVKKELGNNWAGPSRDINENRGGAYLYLVWRLY